MHVYSFPKVRHTLKCLFSKWKLSCESVKLPLCELQHIYAEWNYVLSYKNQTQVSSNYIL